MKIGKLTVHVAHTVKRNAWRLQMGKPKRKREHLENLSVNGVTILKWIFKKQDKKGHIRFIWLRIRTCGGLL